MIHEALESRDERRTPLASSMLYLLVALAAGPRHPRDIATEVRRISAASVSKRTARRLLRRLHDLELVTNARCESASHTPEFALTLLGVAILRDEIARLRSLIDRLDVQALCAATPLVRQS